MNNLEQMMNAIETQCLLSTVVTDPNNVFFGELLAKEGCPVELFPRLEIQMKEENNFEYVNNKVLQPINWFSVSGYTMFTPPNGSDPDEVQADAVISKARLIAVSNFFRETITNLFNLNNLKLAGTLDIDGFIQIHPLYHAVAYHEVIPCMDDFVFNFGIEATRPYDRQ